MTYTWINGCDRPIVKYYGSKPHISNLGDKLFHIKFRFETVWIITDAEGIIEDSNIKITTAFVRQQDGSSVPCIGLDDYYSCRVDDIPANIIWRSILFERIKQEQEIAQ